MASESKKRKQYKGVDGKGADKFLTSKRGMRKSPGYNSSKRQDVKHSGKKEVEEEISDMKHLESFKSFCNR